MKGNVTTTQSFKTAVLAGVLEARLSIVVPYTTPELTKAALKHRTRNHSARRYAGRAGSTPTD
jgi:hypothetical protein